MHKPTYLLSVLLMSASAAFAAPVVLEQPLPAITLQDQHTQPWVVKVCHASAALLVCELQPS